MQAGAQAWLVLQLTDSPFWLGLDAFMATVRQTGLGLVCFDGDLAAYPAALPAAAAEGLRPA